MGTEPLATALAVLALSERWPSPRALRRRGGRPLHGARGLPRAVGSPPWPGLADVLVAARSPAKLLRAMVGEDLAAFEAKAWAERWERLGEKLCCDITTVLDTAYPAALGSLAGRPPFLFVQGRLLPADERAVAVVGAREASAEGEQAARRVAEALAGAGFTVVSGLATGIDTCAHAAALAAGGRTIAVLGCGLGRLAPGPGVLAREVAASGAVVSQFWPEQRPAAWTFPLRNEVTSGLSAATVVVEASARSGARLQARLAAAQGRRVVLLATLARREPWAAELAAMGATVVAGPGELLEALG